MRKLDTVLNINPATMRDPQMRLRVLNMQASAAVSVLNLALKANEAQFRQRSTEGVENLMTQVRAILAQRTPSAADIIAVESAALAAIPHAPPVDQSAD